MLYYSIVAYIGEQGGQILLEADLKIKFLANSRADLPSNVLQRLIGIFLNIVYAEVAAVVWCLHGAGFRSLMQIAATTTAAVMSKTKPKKTTNHAPGEEVVPLTCPQHPHFETVLTDVDRAVELIPALCRELAALYHSGRILQARARLVCARH